MSKATLGERIVGRYRSPLRYPGGKSGLAPFVKALLRENRLGDCTYVEPYAGGASLALALLFEECASRIYLNDADPAVFAFWRSVLHETEALTRLVRTTPVTPESWKQQRLTYQRGRAASPLELGFAAFFLNRTNRSGIIASGGMIGGARQAGRWTMGARYNAHELSDRIERIAEYADRITISNLDAVNFLTTRVSALGGRVLVYLDPPYYVKGRRRLYANYYDHGDHAKVAKHVHELRVPWMLSYDDAPEIRALYTGYNAQAYSLRYTAAERQSGAEVMFFSPSLRVPTSALGEGTATVAQASCGE